MQRFARQTNAAVLSRAVRFQSTSNISGSLFTPKYNFVQGQPITQDIFKPQRSMAEIRTILSTAKAAGIQFSVTGHMRGLDGPGSSLDLPEFQRRLTDPAAKSLDELPSTLTVASGFTSKITIEPASDPESIEYVATDYGINDPYRVKGPVTLNAQRRCPKGMLDAPAFVLTNLFKIKGVKVTVEAIAPMALAGGMESSNVFLTSLIAVGSMLSDSGLSEADIFSLAVKLENDEFAGLTGGQGHLCCLLGGAHRHVWLSGVCPKYAAFSYPVLSEDNLVDLEQRIMLVQAGKEYKDGKAVTARTASLTNNMWTDLLRDQDSVGLPLHKEKIGIAAKYTDALKRKDFDTVVDCVIRYTEIRDAITRRWMSLAIAGHEGRSKADQAVRYAQKSLGCEDPEYKTVRQLYGEKKAKAEDVSLYTLDPIATLVAKGRKEKVAIMPLGAGGPGANLIAISAQGVSHLKAFMAANGLPELIPNEVRKIITGTGLLKGYALVKTGKKPLVYEGFSRVGLEPPEGPIQVQGETYQQLMGRLPK